MQIWIRLFAILLALIFVIPTTSEAKSKYTKRKVQAVPVLTESQQNDAESDQINVQRAKKVDQAVTDIEGQITGMARQYKEGSVWREAANEQRFKAGSKWKFLKYPLAAPSYVVRFVTWPGAIAADYLNRKGVIKKVVNIVSSKDRTFWVYPKFELGFGYGIGTGIGVRHYDLFHRQYQFLASYQIHMNLNQEFYTHLKKDDVFKLGNHPIGFKALTSFIHNYDAPFYGVGAESSRNARSIYKKPLKN